MIPVSIVPRKKEKPKRERQSRLPSKPKFEPKSKIVAGNHKVVFVKGSEIKNGKV